LREIYLRSLKAPIVLFVHPWEFIDLRMEKIRYDCRFRTGDVALQCVGDVLSGMQGAERFSNPCESFRSDRCLGRWFLDAWDG